MESSLKKSVVHVEHTSLLADDNEIADLQRGNKAETDLSFQDAMRLYKPAVFWSMFFSLGVVMCAFDGQLLSSLYATPAFRRDFGYRYDDGYVLPAQWMSALSMGGPAGQTFGALFAAYPMERFGRKKTFGTCVVLTASFVFLQFFARSLEVLFMGELFGGLVLGTYVVIAPSYASEVCPLALRGVLTSCTNICFVAGQLIASIVTTWTSRLDSHWAYSAPFATQWIWPIVILIGLPFAPESPWWLQRHGRLEEAEESLRQLASSDTVDVKPALAMIIETDRFERKLEVNSTWWDCLSGTNLRRTEIAVGVYCVQVVSGVYLVGYATYFFELAGLTTPQAFIMNIGFLVSGFFGTCISWVLLVRYSRRSIYATGIAVLAVLQLMIAILDCAPDYERHRTLAWGQVIIMLVWNLIYGMSLGPLCFVILCEVSATRLRSKTIAIATATQATLGMMMALALPYIFNKDQLNARGKIGFLFGTSALLCLVWAWLRVPELSGRTYQQLDIMFERQVKTKDFKDYVIESED